jgi:hypothetical protein
MKQKYLLHFFTYSQVTINNRVQHKIGKPGLSPVIRCGNYEVCIVENLKRIDSIFLFNGFNIYVKCVEDDEEKAIWESRKLVEKILALISFSSLSTIEPVELYSVINITNNNESKFPAKFSVFFDERNIFERSLIQLNVEIIDDVFSCLYKTKELDYVVSAIAWLRDGLTKNGVERFISFFIGIEILSEPLNRLYQTSINNPNETNWAGVKKIFSDELKNTNFKKIYKKRNAIFHGTAEFNLNFFYEVNEYLEILRKALIVSISLLFGLKRETLGKILNITLADFKSFTGVTFKANLVGEICDNLDEIIKKGYPRYILNKREIRYSVDEKGFLDINGQPELEMHLPENLKYDHISCETWSEDIGVETFNPENIIINKP